VANWRIDGSFEPGCAVRERIHVVTPATICSVSGTPLSRSSWISSFMRIFSFTGRRGGCSRLSARERHMFRANCPVFRLNSSD
jgi:hypothetical protein